MSETCTVKIFNNSGRSIDSIMLWHTSLVPDGGDITPDQAIINQQHVSFESIVDGTAALTWGSPTDYWTAGVLFEGDGTTYMMCGVLGDPYKEYEVSDGSTITFVVNAYTANTTNQSDMSISYTGDDGGMAFLLNPVTVVLVALGNAIVEALTDGGGDEAAQAA